MIKERAFYIILAIALLTSMAFGFILYPLVNPCKSDTDISDKIKYNDEIKKAIPNLSDSALLHLADSIGAE